MEFLFKLILKCERFYWLLYEDCAVWIILTRWYDGDVTKLYIFGANTGMDLLLK